MTTFLVIALICAFIGALVAGSKGKNPILWAAICFATGVIGLIIIACQPAEKKDAA